MKKKIIPILVCLILAVATALCGCGGDSYSKIKVSGTQQYDYTVYSNGGMAVQYGNYVYFINGYAGYDDADGKQNTWPNVVKGGLYRAEFNGEKGADGEFVIAGNAQAVTPGLEFVSTVKTDSDGAQTDEVTVQRIAPKRIGTSGYAKGGIFIYDKWVYFATPNNEKNKSGTVQTTKTDFFRARLDGSDVQKIYTTSSGNESSPYAFYKYDGAVYLVAKDGSDLISVRVAKKPGKKVTICQNVTDVLLPYSETYYEGMNEHDLNHFVYVLRSVGEDDSQKTGNVIEIMRPNGKEGGVVHSQGKTDTLEAVRDGLLFYRTTDPSGVNTLINYTSLHDFLMNEELDVSPSYRKYHSELESYVDADGKFVSGVTEEQKAEYLKNGRRQLDGTILSTSSVSDYTSTYCFRPAGELSDLVYMIGVKSGSAELRSNLPIESDTVAVTIWTPAVHGDNDDGDHAEISSITFANVAGAYLYFTGDDSVIYRTRWDIKASAKTNAELAEKVSDKEISETNYNGDYCAGYIVYTADVNGLADSYTFFKKVGGPVGSEAIMVGRIIDADVLTAPSISLKNGEISWKAIDNAESYTVYYLDSEGTTHTAQTDLTETSYTVGEMDAGTYTFWVVATAEGVNSDQSNTVTHTAA